MASVFSYCLVSMLAGKICSTICPTFSLRTTLVDVKLDDSNARHPTRDLIDVFLAECLCIHAITIIFDQSSFLKVRLVLWLSIHEFLLCSQILHHPVDVLVF